jgi:uncharacterized membrane protein
MTSRLQHHPATKEISVMRKLSKMFLAGLAAILPIAITVYILVWLGQSAESAFRGMIEGVLNGIARIFHLSAIPYVPGMGLAAGFVIIFLIGLLLQVWVFRRLLAYGERLLKRIPVVKTVYGAVRDLMSFLSESKEKSLNQVVMVTLGNTNLRLVGFVTREDFSAFPKDMATADTIAVYLPMSYQMGGFTALLPRSAVKPIEMSFEDAMRFALTAGMSSGEEEKKG